jgi:hypothetical protein
MDRVLFGDNQFFGVNHMSEEKARAQSMRFQGLQAIVEVLDAAYQGGIRTFMCTTHERVAGVCDYFRAHREQYPDYLFYPCMPYAHKYANAVTELGMLEALRRFLPEEGALGTMLKAGAAVAGKDARAIVQLLVDAEMKMFHGLATPVIFVQNVITDLLLGLGMKQALRFFADHVREKYRAEPGFITMNLPRLLDVLAELGIDNPIVCANINRIGFRMCGGIELYEKTIAERRFRPVAMSVFASGAIAPREALEYVCGQPQIESIVFGASSRANIRHTKALVDELDARRGSPREVAPRGGVRRAA